MFTRAVKRGSNRSPVKCRHYSFNGRGHARVCCTIGITLGTEHKLLLPPLHHSVTKYRSIISCNEWSTDISCTHSGIHHATFNFQVTRYKAVPLMLANSRLIESPDQKSHLFHQSFFHLIWGTSTAHHFICFDPGWQSGSIVSCQVLDVV